MIGKTLSHYKVIEKIGQGGMGEVYRAEDTNLSREVAIKVLPEQFTQDPQRLARFEREAKLLASLNHPNIAAIYGYEEAGDVRFLALELVPGETLQERVAKGPVPVEEALEVCRQIAEGMEAAHEKGVIHRDLKPANVKVTPEGKVKILDFGLAKASMTDDPTLDPAEAPTMSIDATRPGTILGTPAYMSPEQARGYATDARTDIWSFGCVLYEVLTGQQTFSGATTVDIIGALVAADPDWDLLPGTTPAVLSNLLRRCLQEDPQQRFASITETRIEIESAASTPHVGPASRDPHQDSHQLPSEKSLLILPFANQSSNPEDEYFSDGLTEELITDLSRIRGLRIVPSTASFRLKNTEKTLQKIAAKFKVRYVLSGRVRKAGESVRVNAQLIDVWSDRSVWADRYTGDLKDVFELQEEVSRAIAGSLELQIEPSSREPKPEAKEAFLKGRHFFRQTTTSGLQRALECFEKAVTLDPGYGPAFAAQAEAYVTITTSWDALPARETMPKARAAAEKALGLDQRLAEAHKAMGLVATYEWELQRAEKCFQEALRLNPSHTGAHRGYSELLMLLDTRYQEALQHVDRGLAYDPTDPGLRMQRGWVYFFSRDFSRALEEWRQLTKQDPLFSFGHFGLGFALGLTGRAGEAIRSFERGIELDEPSSHHVGLLGWAYALDGQETKAQECLVELAAFERAGRDVAIWKLHVHAGWGDADQVIGCLEQAVEARSSATVFILLNPFTDFVAEDPRFHALLKKMGLEHLLGRRPQPSWMPPQIRAVGGRASPRTPSDS